MTTVDEAAARVKYIQRIAGDNEAAHSEEDRLWHDVLETIADGDSNVALLAATALQTQKIEFDRWYA